MGRTTAANLVPGTVVGTDISLTADIRSQSMRHIFIQVTDFGLDAGATPVAKTKLLYVATGAGTIIAVRALLNDTGTSTDVNFDVEKNGVSVLNAPINITHADTDREVVDGTLTTTSFVADDVFEATLTVTASTGALGPLLWLIVEETQAPQ